MGWQEWPSENQVPRAMDCNQKSSDLSGVLPDDLAPIQIYLDSSASDEGAGYGIGVASLMLGLPQFRLRPVSYTHLTLPTTPYV